MLAINSTEYEIIYNYTIWRVNYIIRIIGYVTVGCTIRVKCQITKVYDSPQIITSFKRLLANSCNSISHQHLFKGIIVIECITLDFCNTVRNKQFSQQLSIQV